MPALAFSSGFADPVLDGQATFHAVMNALARPGSVQALDVDLDPPSPLTPELAAIALALTDHETTLWLDARLAGSAAVVDYLRFHAGVRIVAEPSEAAFALVADVSAMPTLSEFSLGTDEYPDRSTTIVLAVETIEATSPSFDEVAQPSTRTIPSPALAGEGQGEGLSSLLPTPESARTPALTPTLSRSAGEGEERAAGPTTLALTGPGIKHISRLIIDPWPHTVIDQLAANRALFPRGVDLILTAPGIVAALPRTTQISEG